MTELSYHKQEDMKNTMKLRELIRDLPPYTRDFFRGIEQLTSSRTRIAYAYDLRVFFQYLHTNNSVFSGKEVAQITLTDLESLKPVDIEEYMEYLKVYSSAEKKVNSNETQANKRKLASVRSFYKYYYKKEMITYDPAALVAMPRLRDKNIVRLDAAEVSELLDHVDSGARLSDKQLQFHEKTRVRDLGILTILLGTGILV